MLLRIRGMSPEAQQTLFALQVQEEARRLSSSLRLFMRKSFAVLEPASAFQSNWHLDAMAEHLEAVHRGEIRNLIINIPPRHMKSLTVSVMFPAWEWTSRPDLKYIAASYGMNLSTRDSVKCRNLLTSPWYQERWPSLHLSHDEDTKDFFSNTNGGYRIAAGVGGSLSGRGADRLIVDDPAKTQEHESAPAREAVIDWWSSTLVSRVQDPRTVAKIVIAQRISERDLVGFLLEQNGWTHLMLPQEYRATPRVYVHASPPLTADPRTEEGELLWPERFGPEEIAPFKQYAYMYAAQFQQDPVPAGGGLFKRDWWRFFDRPPDHFDEVIQSWDLSFKDADTSSYVVGLVVGKVGGLVYLLDRVRRRMDFPDTVRAIVAISDKWPIAAAKLIEDKANGPAVIAQLRTTVPGLIPILPRGSKEARAWAVSPYVESGNVLLPQGEPWAEEFMAECESFPKGAYNDQVDAFTQAMDRLLLGKDGENQLIPFRAVERAVDRSFVVERGWGKSIAVVADPGGGETVILLRYGPIIRKSWATRELNDQEAVVARVVELVNVHHVPHVIVDTAGLGAPLLVALRSVLGAARVRGFNPDDKAHRDDKYDDRRTEVALALRDQFIFDRISIPNEPNLIAQLTSLRLGSTDRGKSRVTLSDGTPQFRVAALLAAWAGEATHGVVAATPAFLR